MLDTTFVIELTQEETEFMQQMEEEQRIDNNINNETIAMTQEIVNTICAIQESNNIVLCDKNRRCIVEEICHSYGRDYNVDTALTYVNYVVAR